MSSVTDAEGAGWGVKASTSVGVMKNSESTDNAVTMTIGESNIMYRKYIRNPEGLKLTKSASALLKQNPELFLTTYGRHYVYQIKYGGSFLGVIDIFGKTQSNESSLSVFASLSVNEVFGNAKASTDFENKAKDASSFLSVKSTVSTRGGELITSSSTEPYALN
jgi:hypothetical protein